ncbi:DUF3397 domain-containing protein [Bacillus sp. FJAT-29814]|uniref:DUF3397 domain-containing protein n=1 Tax=Bacillus sp. FJAT-29814 TaxID=1729688 RepID=UPI0008298BDB|nr:DUF3397 domain-containing protein [Bacillus sp. FJAT-29814]
MSTIVSNILAFLFIMPFAGFLAVFIIGKLVTKNTRRSVHYALDYSTVFFIFSVHFLLKTIWGNSLFWLIILILILTAMVFVIVHWKVKQDINLKKVMKGFWRFNFLLFSLVYIGLTIYGLIHGALTFTLS